MSNKKMGIKWCPDCGGEGYVDTWDPPRGIDPRMRRFICSNCGCEFYSTVRNSELLEFYDKQLGRK